MDNLTESIKTGLTFVSDTVSEIASSIAEKNRLRVQLNHIKSLIKADSATRDQAYVELGRFFYENLREDASPENEAICAVIDAASERISRASLRYMELLNLQNETHVRSENAEKLKKVIAEKAAAGAKVAREKGVELAGKAKVAAQDAAKKAMDLTAQGAAKAKEAAADLKEKAEDAVEDVKERFDPAADAELEDLIAEEQRKMQEPEVVETAAPAEEAAAEAPAEEAPAVSDEESPESFDF